MESYEEKKNGIDLFKAEISEIKKQEMEKKAQGEKYDPHFENINPKELKEEDKIIYEKFRDGSMNFKEFSAYQQNIVADGTERKVQGFKDSRRMFYAWICNKIAGNQIWLDKFAEEKKEK